jgi:hypothetical protein
VLVPWGTILVRVDAGLGAGVGVTVLLAASARGCHVLRAVASARAGGAGSRHDDDKARERPLLYLVCAAIPRRQPLAGPRSGPGRGQGLRARGPLAPAARLDAEGAYRQEPRTREATHISPRAPTDGPKKASMLP